MTVAEDRTAEPPDTAALMARATALVPVLAGRAEEAERLRQLPPATIDDLKRASLHRICQPRRFGGSEAPLDAAIEIVATLARGCASTAWVAAIHTDHAIIAGMMDPRAADDIWGDDADACISAGLTPGGTAERVDGGWRIAGTWGWSSGCDYADWLILNVLLPGADGGAPVPTFCLVPRAEITIDDNWHVMGLAGTGSKNVVVADAVVPDHRTRSTREINAGAGERGTGEPGPLYRLPHVATVPFLLAAPSLGVAESLLELLIDDLKDRQSRGGKVAELATMQVHIAEAAAEIDSARLLAQRDCAAAMAAIVARRDLTLAERARGRRDQAYTTMLCRRASQRLFTAAGGTALFRSNAIECKFRDLQAISGHLALNWDFAGSTWGRIAFGLDPNTPMV